MHFEFFLRFLTLLRNKKAPMIRLHLNGKIRNRFCRLFGPAGVFPSLRIWVAYLRGFCLTAPRCAHSACAWHGRESACHLNFSKHSKQSCICSASASYGVRCNMERANPSPVSTENNALSRVLRV